MRVWESPVKYTAAERPRLTAVALGRPPVLLPLFADPYLNTDAGTMSPFEHGEVFVLDDGGEVRLQKPGRKPPPRGSQLPPARCPP